MSIAYKCDRCGLFCDGPAKGGLMFKHDGAREWLRPIGTWHELCFTCSMRFVEWFNLGAGTKDADVAIGNAATKGPRP